MLRLPCEGLGVGAPTGSAREGVLAGAGPGRGAGLRAASLSFLSPAPLEVRAAPQRSRRNPASPFQRCLVANLPLSETKAGPTKGFCLLLQREAPCPPRCRGSCAGESDRTHRHRLAGAQGALERGARGTQPSLSPRRPVSPQGALRGNPSPVNTPRNRSWRVPGPSAALGGNFFWGRRGWQGGTTGPPCRPSKRPPSPPLFLQGTPLDLGVPGSQDSATAGKWIYCRRGRKGSRAGEWVSAHLRALEPSARALRVRALRGGTVTSWHTSED